MALKLGEALVKDSLITREQLKLALERQVIFGGRIGTNIIELGILKEKELSSFLSRYFKVPSVDPAQITEIGKEVIDCIPADLAEKHKLLPFRKDRNRLHVAMLEPRDLHVIDELRFKTGFDIIPYVISELRLLHALEKYYNIERDLRYISTFLKDDEEKKPAAEESADQLRKVKEEFSNAREKEEIIGVLLNETNKIAKRCGIFLLKGNQVSGWKGRGLGVEAFLADAAGQSLFAEVIAKRNYYRGPLLKIAANEPLITLLNGTPQDCIALPIQIREKIIGILYADNGNQAVLDASINYLHKLISMASLSFEIVILRKKIADL
ncbi:MAG: general secretion pathway protein GspE [Thermodesulfovibrionales bacterium]